MLGILPEYRLNLLWSQNLREYSKGMGRFRHREESEASCRCKDRDHIAASLLVMIKEQRRKG